ncbi:MAG: hypothetical protein PWP27_1792 [Clostridiales bacterium]|jgi:NAD(P)H-nitrite reductase large subunit|nr:hypothetical protein [Clostridiales bacterium]MDK2933982.1 hypothetical protein [Clostridiales bacterium]
MEYVIVGNSAAAIAAVEGIRKNDKKGNITLISDEKHHTYSRPLISYYLGDKVKEEGMYYREQDFYTKNNVKTLLGEKAVEIKKEEKKVVLDSGEKISYNKLLIATGSVPFVPPMDGLEGKENIYTFLKWDDATALKSKVKRQSRVIVIGAGLIGLKAAEGLNKLTDDVTVVELADRVLSTILDHQAASIVQKQMEQQGTKFVLNNTVVQICGDGKVEKVILKDGKALPCDILIIAIGVRPNVALAQTAGIQINRGIMVDSKMETSVNDIYAAGDVTESMDITVNTNRILALWPNAYQQGEIAGYNMSGGKMQFDGAFPMNAIGFFGLPMITAGIVNPTGEGYSVYMEMNEDDQWLKKFVVKEDVLVGFILLNKVDRAGIYTSLIRDKVSLGVLKHHLLEDGFGLKAFPKSIRKEKMLMGGRK